MHKPRTASATSPWSATAAAARPRCTRRCCSRRARPTGSVASPTARRSPTPTPTSRRAQMSISRALSSFEWQDRKINLHRHAGRAELRRRRARRAARLRVGGLRRQRASWASRSRRARLWERAAELDIARMIFVNMLDRERADFFRTLESLKAAFGPHVVATEIPIGSEHEVRGVIDLVDMKAYEYDGGRRATTAREIPIPDDLQALAEEYREKLMDEVAEVSDALMERYLEGEEISHDEIVDALKDGTNHGGIFPVVCGVATRNLGTNRLLDAIVEDLPSPVKHGAPRAARDHARARRRRSRCSPTSSRRAPTRSPGASTSSASTRASCSHDSARAQHAHAQQGAHRPAARLRGQGDRATPTSSARATSAPSPSSRRRARATGSPTRDEPITMPAIELPAPVMAFAMEPKAKGDEDKVFTSLRRLQEEDPTIDLHRDPQTGEQIVAGPVADPRRGRSSTACKSRFGAEVDAQAAARALPGDDPQAGQGPRPPQEADRRPRPVRRLPHRDRAAASRRRTSSSSTRSRAA